jgi:predicted alpha/beta-fold hydrolase
MFWEIFTQKAFLFTVIPICLLFIWRFIHRKASLYYARTQENHEILEKCPTILKSVFLPTIYLQNGLLQTACAGLLPHKGPDVKYRIEEIKAQGGGHTSLAWAEHSGRFKNPKHSKVLVVVIPGLTGSSDDNYVKDLINTLGKDDYRCVVYQPRFNGGKLVLPEEGFLDILRDFKNTMDHIKEKEKDTKLFGIGHSYGANLLVNYLGAYPNDDRFIGAVSLANPFNLLLAINKMQNSIVEKKMTEMVKETADKSRKELLEEGKRFNLNLEELQNIDNLRAFDRGFTIKVYGYDSVDEYYWGISSCRRFRSITVPIFMMQAQDDPVVDAKAFVKDEIEKSNPNAIVMVTKEGGHQGWMEGFFSLRRWYLKPTREYVNAIVDLAAI